MGATGPPVKSGRRYDASGRRRRAEARRREVLRVAEELFLRNGYAATTLGGLAEAAGVSVETISKSFGGKAGLVRAIQQTGLAGTGPVPAPERSDEMSAREQDADALLRSWSELSREVAPEVSPIMLLVRAAAGADPDMAVLLAEMNDQRLDRMAHNARRLAATGGLRPGVGLATARDVMFTLTAPELYELLVLLRGWPLVAYSDFIYRALRAELLA